MTRKNNFLKKDEEPVVDEKNLPELPVPVETKTEVISDSQYISHQLGEIGLMLKDLNEKVTKALED